MSRRGRRGRGAPERGGVQPGHAGCALRLLWFRVVVVVVMSAAVAMLLVPVLVVATVGFDGGSRFVGSVGGSAGCWVGCAPTVRESVGPQSAAGAQPPPLISRLPAALPQARAAIVRSARTHPTCGPGDPPMLPPHPKEKLWWCMLAAVGAVGSSGFGVPPWPPHFSPTGEFRVPDDPVSPSLSSANQLWSQFTMRHAHCAGAAGEGGGHRKDAEFSPEMPVVRCGFCGCRVGITCVKH